MLRLKTCFVTSNQQQCSVHDGGAVKHGDHENGVFWTVDEGDVSNKIIFPIVRDGYKRAFSQFSKWVLDTKSGTGGEERGQGQRGEHDMQRVLMQSCGR